MLDYRDVSSIIFKGLHRVFRSFFGCEIEKGPKVSLKNVWSLFGFRNRKKDQAPKTKKMRSLSPRFCRRSHAPTDVSVFRSVLPCLPSKTAVLQLAKKIMKF